MLFRIFLDAQRGVFSCHTQRVVKYSKDKGWLNHFVFNPLDRSFEAKASGQRHRRIGEQGVTPASIHIGVSTHNPKYGEEERKEDEKRPEAIFFLAPAEDEEQHQSHDDRYWDGHQDVLRGVVPRQIVRPLHRALEKLAEGNIE